MISQPFVFGALIILRRKWQEGQFLSHNKCRPNASLHKFQTHKLDKHSESKLRTSTNMNTDKIKNLILLNIEHVALTGNEKSLKKVLDYVQEIVDSAETAPVITDDSIQECIRDDSNIIVPIVCDDMFEYVVNEGESQTIGDFICEQNRGRINENVTKAIKTNFYFGLSLYENGRDRSNSLYKTIAEGFKSGKLRLRDSVKNFLRKGKFQLIVTTVGFPVIESCLDEMDYESEWYNPNRRNDLPLIKDSHSRVVYHIFGGKTPNAWVYNEQTLLKFVHALHSGDYGAKNLSNYLCGIGQEDIKRPLVLGATLPDWLFRFFIYPMYEEKIKESNGYWLSLTDIEKGLDLFLSRNKYIGQTNLREGNRVDAIITGSTSTFTEIATEEVTNKKPKIFISYKREEADTVMAETLERIIGILQKQGTVWLDTQKVSDAGNPYWANIKNAVRDCDLFVPLVTPRYINEYINIQDIDQYSGNPPADALYNDANDLDDIRALKPVIREAYYAIAYNKKMSPIVVIDKKNSLGVGSLEMIARDVNDPRNLPQSIFSEHTLLLHNDDKPSFFNLPKID